MSEALAVIGLASSIITFVDMASKIVSRINDFRENAREVPKSFRDIAVQLPVLIDITKQIQASCVSCNKTPRLTTEG